MMNHPSVIVIEDEKDLRDSLVTYLGDHQIHARGVADALGLDAEWAKSPADILILDVGLPEENGFSIAARFRQFSSVGIIMLTALNQDTNRIMGIESGADNYLVKPVSLREVLATVHRLHQRIGISPPPSVERPAIWGLDALNWVLTSPQQHRIRLTATEFRFVSLFLSRQPGEIVNYDDILRLSGRGAVEASTHRLESIIARLRRKVLNESGQALPLRAAHGQGYTMQCKMEKII